MNICPSQPLFVMSVPLHACVAKTLLNAERLTSALEKIAFGHFAVRRAGAGWYPPFIAFGPQASQELTLAAHPSAPLWAPTSLPQPAGVAGASHYGIQYVSFLVPSDFLPASCCRCPTQVTAI